MVATDEAADWARGLDGLVEQIAPRFRRIAAFGSYDQGEQRAV